jgi:6-phosphogluconolactonase
VIVSSYLDATVQVYPLGRRGDFQPLFCLRRHIGKSVVAGRQDQAHVHSMTASPDGRYVIACDLGTDQLVVYYMDPDSTKLRLERTMTTSLPAGSGPRHMLFSPDGQRAYVVGELSSEVLVLTYRPGQPFRVQQRISCREGEKENLAAAIRMTADGRKLYVSNRGEDTIACFQVQPDGSLRYQAAVPTGGQSPRDFILTPDERFLVCANQNSDNLVSFARDDEGTLRYRDTYAGISQPVCTLCW